MHRSRWFTPSLVLLAFLGGAAYLWAQAGAHNPRTDLWDFLNGIQLGGGTVITGTTGAQDSAVNLPANSVGGGEMSGVQFNVILCGQAAENAEIFLGPATTVLGGDASTDTSIGSAACDALDDATEATADAPLFANIPFKIMGLYCRTDGTLGVGETVVFKTRSAEADTTPSITCTIGATQTDCRSLLGSTTNVAAGATVAISATQTSNNADDNLKCNMQIALQ
jgi:hypothetical protein